MRTYTLMTTKHHEKHTQTTRVAGHARTNTQGGPATHTLLFAENPSPSKHTNVHLSEKRAREGKPAPGGVLLWDQMNTPSMMHHVCACAHTLGGQGRRHSAARCANKGQAYQTHRPGVRWTRAWRRWKALDEGI